jgi:hypothetical protein
MQLFEALWRYRKDTFPRKPQLSAGRNFRWTSTATAPPALNLSFACDVWGIEISTRISLAKPVFLSQDLKRAIWRP